jgi:hypothetical protein
MYAIREIVTSPWFRWSFAIIAVIFFISVVRGGGSVGEAFVLSITNALLWSLAISGIHRLFTRYR